jgi:hypothetical protein
MLRQRKIWCCHAAAKTAIRSMCSKDQLTHSQVTDLPVFRIYFTQLYSAPAEISAAAL